jgi:hypothetical protein
LTRAGHAGVGGRSGETHYKVDIESEEFEGGSNLLPTTIPMQHATWVIDLHVRDALVQQFMLPLES